MWGFFITWCSLLRGNILKRPQQISLQVPLDRARSQACVLAASGIRKVSSIFSSFPGGSDGRVCLLCGRPGFNPWVGKIPQEKEMVTHSSILAWEIPWTEDPGWLQSGGSQKNRIWLSDSTTTNHVILLKSVCLARATCSILLGSDQDLLLWLFPPGDHHAPLFQFFLASKRGQDHLHSLYSHLPVLDSFFLFKSQVSVHF